LIYALFNTTSIKTDMQKPSTATQIPISFEFFPPNTHVGEEKLKSVVQQLSVLNPEFFSVTYGAGGSTREKTLQTVKAIAATGFEAAPHLSCIGSSREQLTEILQTYAALNIKRIVALRGDLPSGTASAGDFKYAAELVAYIRQTFGQKWLIEVAAYPEYHPTQRYAARDLAHYVDKVKAGADAAITQFFCRANSKNGRCCASDSRHYAFSKLRQNRSICRA
jgi:methylenetetrahydrofolate reductase (NADPH)